MLAFKIPDLRNLPALKPSGFGSAAVDQKVTQSGYGAKGVPILDPTGKAEYKLVPEYGTLRTGPNQITSIPKQPVITRYVDCNDNFYSFSGLQGQLTFNPPKGLPANLVGSSYLFPGDSGGPTFAVIDNALREVGVHADSERLLDLNGDTVARQGFVWLDVNLGFTDAKGKTPYIDFINKACKDDVARLSVPEPRSLSLMIGWGVLVLGWVAYRSTRMGQRS